MKFSIHDLTATEMQTCMAALAGRGGAVVSPAAPIAPPAGDDDDNAPANAAAPSVDSTGLPWDERIHAKSKALTGDGKWRARRGVDDATVATVTAELRARAPQAPTPAGMPLPPPAPVGTAAPLAPPAGMPLPPPAAPVQSEAPVFVPPPPMPVAPPAPPAPVAPAAPTDFVGFMNMISGLLQSGKVDAPYLADLTSRINAACNTGFAAITDLNTRPDLLAWVVSVMQSEGRA